MNIVFIFQIFYLTKSNFLVSILILTFIIPQIFLSFIGGIIADLRDKKKILFYGNVLRAFLFLPLVLYPSSVPLILIISFIVSIVTQLYIPAETPMVPKLVQKKDLLSANALFSMAIFGTILLGYIVAGPLLDLLGKANIFLFLSMLFMIASFFIAIIPNNLFHIAHTAELHIRKVKYSITSELQRTYRILSTTGKVIGPFLFLIASQVIVLVLATVIPGYANSILQVRAEELSIIVFGPASLGMMISAFLIGRYFKRFGKERLITYGLFVSGLIMCLFPFTTKIVARDIFLTLNIYLPSLVEVTPVHFAVVLSFLAGFSNAFIFIPSQTIIQEEIPEEFRSKVYGLLFGMIGAFSLLPVIITGGLADIIGVGSVLFILGVIIIVTAFVRSTFVYAHGLIKKYR